MKKEVGIMTTMNDKLNVLVIVYDAVKPGKSLRQIHFKLGPFMAFVHHLALI